MKELQRRSRASGLGLVVCALALGACEGPNFFTGPAGAGDGGENAVLPEVVAVGVPEFVRPNDVMEVRIQAVAPAGVTSVDVTLSGAMVRQRTLVIDPADADLDVRTDFLIPGTVTPGEIILVRVAVTDDLGQVSEAVELEVPVVEDDDPF